MRSAGMMSMESNSVSRISRTPNPTVRKRLPPKYTIKIWMMMTEAMMNRNAQFLRKCPKRLSRGVRALKALNTPLKINSVKKAVRKGSGLSA